MSVTAEVHSNCETFWRFKFYDIKTQEIVGKIKISGDGTTQLDW